VTRQDDRHLTEVGASIWRWRLLQLHIAAGLAERAGMSRSSLQNIAREDAGVSISAVMSVVQAPGQLEHVSASFGAVNVDVGKLRSAE
jgi:DNA-binding phage protein